MFCRNCGAQIDDNASICVYCGTNVKNNKPKSEKGSVLWWLIGFFIPIAGIIVWAVNKDSDPKNAKNAGIGAIVGIIISIVLTILIYVIYFVFIFAIADYSYSLM